MTRTARRTLLVGTASVFLLAQAGCATRGAPAQRSPERPPVSEQEREACERLARAEAAEVKGTSVAMGMAEGAGQGFIVGMHAYIVGGIVIAPLGAIFGAVGTAWKNAKARRQAHDRAMESCLAGDQVAERTDAAQGPDIGSDRAPGDEQLGTAPGIAEHAIADPADAAP